MEDAVANSGAATSSSAPAMSAGANRLAGSSGVIVSRSSQILSTHRPFQGQGHVLSGKLMPATAADAHSSEISETQTEPTDMHTGEPARTKGSTKAKRMPSMTRKGPGVSVLNPEVVNEINENATQLHNLQEAIGGILNAIQSAPKHPEDSSDITMFEAQPPAKKEARSKVLRHSSIAQSEDTIISASVQEVAASASHSLVEMTEVQPDILCDLIASKPDPDTRQNECTGAAYLTYNNELSAAITQSTASSIDDAMETQND